MYYSAIKYKDIANGLGVRTVLFVSGCRNRCEGCFQPETWNFKNGKVFDDAAKEEIFKSLEPDYIKGITLLGGDPMEPENQEGLLPFMRELKLKFPDKDVWAFTGYILDQDLVKGGRKYTKDTDELLSYIDVLVDGPFILSKKDMMLKFCGSSNQRLIDLKETLKQGKIVKLEI